MADSYENQIINANWKLFVIVEGLYKFSIWAGLHTL